MTRIYISRESIVSNHGRRPHDQLPVVCVEVDGVPPAYADDVRVLGPCRVVYRRQDDQTLPSAWVETDADVMLVRPEP